MMKKLWAPWRVKYLTITTKKQKGCVFCRMVRQGQDKKNLIFVRSQYSFAVLNLYPYNNGHALVLPYRHVADLDLLSAAQREDLFALLAYTKKLLTKVLRPDGFNIGINIGKAAGAGFPGHVHIHIVPRWQGDANFMPVVTDMRVISQSLTVLHKLLVKAKKDIPK